MRVSHVFSVTNRRVMGFAGLGCCVMIVHDRDDQKEREDGFPQCVLPFFDHCWSRSRANKAARRAGAQSVDTNVLLQNVEASHELSIS